MVDDVDRPVKKRYCTHEEGVLIREMTNGARPDKTLSPATTMR